MSRFFAGPEELKRREVRYRYVLLKDGFTTPSGLKHDVYGEFYIRIHVDPSKRTKFEIQDTEIGLRARFGEPLKDVQKRAPYPRDTALDLFLRKEGGFDGASKLPILDSLEIHYGLIYDRWVEEHPRGFHMEITTLSESGDQGFSSGYTVASGLDPLELRDGTKLMEGFKSENTLGGIDSMRGMGGHGWGPPFSDWKFLRKGHVVSKSACEPEFNGPTAYSVPDLDALPMDTPELIIDMPELRDEELVHVKRLKALRYLGIAYCEKVTGAGLDHVATIGGLAGLTLAGERLEDEGLKHLSRLPALQRLTIYDAYLLTDAGFHHLGRIPSLGFLGVYGCRKLTDTCIEELAALPKLKDLELAGPHESSGDWGPRPLAKITSLERVEVWRPGRASAADLAALARMPSLRKVLFYETPLTDAVLGELGASKSIEEVYVCSSKEITAAGLKKLLEMAGLKTFVANECPRLLKEDMQRLQESFKGEFLLKFSDLRSPRE